LKQYKDVFARDYKDLKGPMVEMVEVKIDLILATKPIKKRMYNLAHKSKSFVK